LRYYTSSSSTLTMERLDKRSEAPAMRGRTGHHMEHKGNHKVAAMDHKARSAMVLCSPVRAGLREAATRSDDGDARDLVADRGRAL
jgi:hypothetical protein